MNRLSERLATSLKDETRIKEHLLEMAAIWRSTYDIDPDHFLVSADDIKVLVECTMMLYDNMRMSIPNVMKRLLDGDCRLSHLLEPLLPDRINKDCSGLDLAVKTRWGSYCRGTVWHQQKPPGEHWFTTTTDPGIDQRTHIVQYNTFEGQLLVDEKPIGCLPQNILKHETYSRIFGQVGKFCAICN